MKTFSRLFMASALMCTSLWALSQQPDTTAVAAEPEPEKTSISTKINESGTGEVTQPDKLNALLMQPATGDSTAPAETKRVVKVEEEEDENAPVEYLFRVQVYSSNDVRNGRTKAHGRASAVACAYPQHRPHVSFDSPYWRARIGDIKTQEEGEELMKDVKSRFPQFAAEVRLVRVKNENYEKEMEIYQYMMKKGLIPRKKIKKSSSNKN